MAIRCDQDVRGTRANLSQYLRSPRRRGHIQERASQQQIIGAGRVVRRAALVTDEHVRGHIRR